jgi:hypothetical protein
MKTRYLLSFTILSVLLVAAFPAHPQEFDRLDFSIELVNMRMLFNDRVGENWEYVAYVNGHVVTMGQKYHVFMDRPGSLVLVALAREVDDDPDIGRKKLRVPYRELSTLWNRYMDRRKPVEQEYRVTVRVDENDGESKGNEALVEFVFLLRISEDVVR